MSHVPDSAQLDSVYCTVYIVQYIVGTFLLIYPYQIKHFCLNNGGGQLD